MLALAMSDAFSWPLREHRPSRKARKVVRNASQAMDAADSQWWAARIRLSAGRRLRTAVGTSLASGGTADLRRHRGRGLENCGGDRAQGARPKVVLGFSGAAGRFALLPVSARCWSWEERGRRMPRSPKRSSIARTRLRAISRAATLASVFDLAMRPSGHSPQPSLGRCCGGAHQRALPAAGWEGRGP